MTRNTNDIDENIEQDTNADSDYEEMNEQTEIFNNSDDIDLIESSDGQNRFCLAICHVNTKNEKCKNKNE